MKKSVCIHTDRKKHGYCSSYICVSFHSCEILQQTRLQRLFPNACKILIALVYKSFGPVQLNKLSHLVHFLSIDKEEKEEILNLIIIDIIFCYGTCEIYYLD